MKAPALDDAVDFSEVLVVGMTLDMRIDPVVTFVRGIDKRSYSAMRPAFAWRRAASLSTAAATVAIFVVVSAALARAGMPFVVGLIPALLSGFFLTCGCIAACERLGYVLGAPVDLASAVVWRLRGYRSGDVLDERQRRLARTVAYRLAHAILLARRRDVERKIRSNVSRQADEANRRS